MWYGIISCIGLIARPAPRRAARQQSLPLESQPIETVTRNHSEERWARASASEAPHQPL